VHVPAGMPQLPRPASLPPPRPSLTGADTPAASLAPAASDIAFANARAAVDAELGRAHAAIDRAEMLMKTDRAAGAHRSMGWPLWGLLLALAGGALYLGTSAIKASSGTAPSGMAAPRAAGMAEATAATPNTTATEKVPVERSALVAPAVVADPPPGPAVPTPAPPASIRLTPSGAPRGARVWHDGKALGDAESGVTLPYGTAPLAITVTAPGHEPHTLQVTPNADASPEVKLKRKAKAEKPGGNIPSDLESPF